MSLVASNPIPTKKAWTARHKVVTIAKRVVNWYVMRRPLLDMSVDTLLAERFTEEDAVRLINDAPEFALEGLHVGQARYRYVVRAVVRIYMRRYSWMEPSDLLQEELQDLRCSYKRLEREHMDLVKEHNNQVPKKRKRLPRMAKGVKLVPFNK